MGFRAKNGFLLLWLMLFFTVLALSSTSAILQRDTGLKRFKEEDLKVKINNLRRAIDLYKYKYSVTSDNPTKIKALNSYLATGTATDVAILLAGESFIRARVATGSNRWKLISNLVHNPSFELDNGEKDYLTTSGWQGNYTADDKVPDGWQLTPTGAEQVVDIPEAGTWIVSFWARSINTTSKTELAVETYPGAANKGSLVADAMVWKRYFKSFTTSGPESVKISVSQTSSNIGDYSFVDGVMLEKWKLPTGLPATTLPAPSAWTKDYTIIPDIPEKMLKEKTFENLIITDGTSDDYNWWFQW